MFSRRWRRFSREHVREGRAASRKKERERERGAGGASIYQRRREVGGCMRRIAPCGRSLINSGRRRSGASVESNCRRSSSEETTGAPSIFRGRVRAYLKRARQRSVSSADGERACADAKSQRETPVLFFSLFPPEPGYRQSLGITLYRTRMFRRLTL